MLDRENRASDQPGGEDAAMNLSENTEMQPMQQPEPQSQEGVRKGRGRGFASMDPSKQREIASKGGKAAHAKGTAHEFTSEEAREAGRKGGQARGKNRTH